MLGIKIYCYRTHFGDLLVIVITMYFGIRKTLLLFETFKPIIVIYKILYKHHYKKC